MDPRHLGTANKCTGHRWNEIGLPTAMNIATSQKPDLRTVSGIEAYLVDTPFASKSVTELSGGNANFTYRARLDRAYEGQTSVVLKHAQGYLKIMESIALDISRQMYEVEALKRVRALLPDNAIVTVPRVFHFDEDSHVVVMEDCGDAALTLKRFMQEGRSSPRLAEQIGTALGEFLGWLHTLSRTDSSLCDFFDGHKMAKDISAWVTYGQILSTLTEDQLPALRDPPLDVSESQLDVLRKICAKMSLAITTARDTFVMGDFWPGNMMVTLKDDGDLDHIYVVDWEVCRPGVPGVELGQFCAEMHLLRRFHPACEADASTILTRFLETYARIYKPDTYVHRTALQHLGGHLVVWTPRVAWGGKEKTREVVVEGVELMASGYSNTDEGLRGTLVGGLFVE